MSGERVAVASRGQSGGTPPVTKKPAAKGEEAKDKSKKKRRKKVKKKKSSGTSDSGTEDPDSSSRSETDSSSSSFCSTSAESEDGDDKSKKKKRKRSGTIWNRLKDIWAMEARPEHMRHRKGVKNMSLGEIIRYKEHFEKESEKRGMGEAIFGRDQKLKSKQFPAQKDNGGSKLHPARWERLPMAEPKRYWKKVPKKREDIFRHLYLAHYGAEGLVNEATLVRLHDRQVPVELCMLHGANFTKVKSSQEDKGNWSEPAEVRQLQVAVLNYATVMQILWPFDYGPLVLMRVLIESRWGETGGGNEKSRIQLVSRFFNEVVKENSGRAVRGEPPVDFERARSKWSRLVGENTLPGGGGAPPGEAKQSQAGSGSRQFQRQGGGGGGNGAANGGLRIPKVLHNNRPLCFGYNQASGCGRKPGASDACKDYKGSLFAHYCNYFDRSTGQHCLRQHPRVQFH